ELPHAAGDGAVAAHHVGEALAGLGAGFVDGAGIAVEEDAAGLIGTFEDDAFLFAFGGVIVEELLRRGAEEFSQAFDVALGDGDGGDAAAVGADGAVDLLLDFLADAAEDAVGVIARLHEAAEALVVAALLFAFDADLDQVGQHSFRVAGRR